MGKLVVIDHPLVQHKLTLLRDKATGTKEFRALVEELATLLAYEATRDLQLEDATVETPVATAHTKVLAGKKLAIVPILRAGLGMVDGMMNLIPAAKVGHIGLYRDPETLLQAALRYFREGYHYSRPHAGYRRQRQRGH